MGESWNTAIPHSLVAQLGGGREFKLLWPTLAVIGVMLLGAAIIEAVRRWRSRPVPSRLSSTDQLAHFRSLYDRGELSEEEFNRLQAVLGERIKKELDIPVAATAAAAPQSSANSGTSSTGTEAAAASPPSPNGAPPAPDGNAGPGTQGPPAR